MKLRIALCLILFFPASVAAATLSWDYESDVFDQVDGYTVYYTDGESDYNKTFGTDDVEINEEDGRVLYSNIEGNLNLHHGVEYTFHLTRYNEAGESDKSNSVSWTRPSYDPPTDQLPDDASSKPSGLSNPGVD